MADPTTPSNLDELGDALASATERDLHRRSRRPVRRIALVVAALAVVTAGTAAAAGLFSPRQVAQGMPAGTAIFDQTDPTCVANPDGSSFRCTLSTAPGQDDGITDFTGTKEVVAIDGVAAGGCIGVDPAGMTWDCYLGQDAVDMEIIGPDFLGEPVLGPGRG